MRPLPRVVLAYGFFDTTLTWLSLSVLPSKKLSGLPTRSAATAEDMQVNAIARSELVSGQRMRIVQPRVVGELCSVRVRALQQSGLTRAEHCLGTYGSLFARACRCIAPPPRPKARANPAGLHFYGVPSFGCRSTRAIDR